MGQAQSLELKQGPPGDKGDKGDKGDRGDTGSPPEIPSVVDYLTNSSGAAFRMTLAGDAPFKRAMSTELNANSEFKTFAISELSSNAGFQSSVATNQSLQNSLVDSQNLQTKVSALLAANADFSGSVGQKISGDSAFRSLLSDVMTPGLASNEQLQKKLEEKLKSDASFQSSIQEALRTDSTFNTTIKGQVVQDSAFKNDIINLMKAPGNASSFVGPKGTTGAKGDMPTPSSVATVLTTGTSGSAFTNSVVTGLAGNTTFRTAIGGISSLHAGVGGLATFQTAVRDRLRTDTGFIGNVRTALSSDAALRDNLRSDVVSDKTFQTNVVSEMSGASNLSKFRGPTGPQGPPPNMLDVVGFLATQTNLVDSAVGYLADATTGSLFRNSFITDPKFQSNIVTEMQKDNNVTKFKGPQGVPGTIDTPANKTFLKTNTLWCADGDICTVPKNKSVSIDGDINIPTGKKITVRDSNAGLVHTGDGIDGVNLFGWNGGKLSTMAGGKKDVLTWRDNGNVNVLGGINVGGNLEGSNVLLNKNGNENKKWMIHNASQSTVDGRNAVVIAPWNPALNSNKGDWDWSKETIFNSSGDMVVNGSVRMHSQSLPDKRNNKNHPTDPGYADMTPQDFRKLGGSKVHWHFDGSGVVQTIIPWGDRSGGYAMQTRYGGPNVISTRMEKYGEDAWTPWLKVQINT